MMSLFEVSESRKDPADFGAEVAFPDVVVRPQMRRHGGRCATRVRFRDARRARRGAAPHASSSTPTSTASACTCPLLRVAGTGREGKNKFCYFPIIRVKLRVLRANLLR